MAVDNKSIIVRSFTEVWEDGQFDHASASTTTVPGMLVAQYDGGLTTGKDAVAPPRIVTGKRPTLGKGASYGS